MRRRLAVLALLPVLAAGCAGTPAQGQGSGESYSVSNCGRTFTFSSAPERVVLQDASPTETLVQLGVLDRVVAKAGYYPSSYFDVETFEAVDAIKSLSDRLGDAGHLEISKESVVAEEPDLIIGASASVSAETMGDVPVINEPGFCGEAKQASFAHVLEEVDLYAEIFQKQERAEEYKAELQDRIDKLDSSIGQGRSVAVIYPAVKGASVYAYGADSMSNPIVEGLGLHNVFGDEAERVFEIGAEQLAAANPDVIVILHSGEEGLEGYVTELPGAEAITAVKDEAIIPLLLAHAEPPTPLAVDGAELLQEALRGLDA